MSWFDWAGIIAAFGLLVFYVWYLDYLNRTVTPEERKAIWDAWDEQDRRWGTR